MFVLIENYTSSQECYFCSFVLAGIEQILLLRMPVYFMFCH